MAEAAARSDREVRDDRWSGFDDERWRQRMQRSDIADELFMPLVHGDWNAAKFRVVKGEKSRAKTRITGVRYLAADPKGENLEPERAVQIDFHRLVDSLMKLRREPEFGRLCLSKETFRTSALFGGPQRRQFGIVRGGDAKLESDEECARRSYAAIRKSIRRAGFVVLEPTEAFAAGSGLVGLRDWVDRLRLRKRRMWWLWLLLLPLLFLLPKCEANAEFFGAPIETDSFILLIDRSTSMQPHFGKLRAEAFRLLDEITKRGRDIHADIVSYCGSAASCLGAIRLVDDSTRPRLEQFLHDLEPGGGTQLRNAIDLAAREIAQHERPTTLIVLTDAQDSSIAPMARDRDGTLAGFAGVEIHSIAMTPRLFGPSATATVPQDEHEREFEGLAEILGGYFGAVAPQRDGR